jgi:hypothetical protein
MKRKIKGCPGSADCVVKGDAASTVAKLAPRTSASMCDILLPPESCVSFWVDDVKTGGSPDLRDQFGGCTETTQAASGM